MVQILFSLNILAMTEFAMNYGTGLLVFQCDWSEHYEFCDLLFENQLKEVSIVMFAFAIDESFSCDKGDGFIVGLFLYCLLYNWSESSFMANFIYLYPQGAIDFAAETKHTYTGAHTYT